MCSGCKTERFRCSVRRFLRALIPFNVMRFLHNLPPLVEHGFNRCLKLSALNAHLTSLSLSYHIENFSSIYYLGSRFLLELVTDLAEFPRFTNPISKVCYEIQKHFSGGGMGIQQASIVKNNYLNNENVFCNPC